MRGEGLRLGDATRRILDERQRTHGDYAVGAQVSQDLKAVMFNRVGASELTAMEREALDMIAHKLARILSGNPHFEDHWRDIAGYATLVADRLPRDP